MTTVMYERCGAGYVCRQRSAVEASYLVWYLMSAKLENTKQDKLLQQPHECERAESAGAAALGSG